MKKIKNHQELETYIYKYRIDDLFKQDINKYMELHSFNENEAIYSANKKIEYFYFLVKGKIKIYSLLENGKTILLRFNKPLSVIGDLELLGKYNIRTVVETVTEAKLLAISLNFLRTSALNETKFLQFVIKNLSHKLYTVSNTMSINLSYTFEERLASYLLSVSTDENKIKKRGEIKTSTFSEIASLLGGSYRHLNRVIKKFSDQGIIERENNSIKIKDGKKLKELSAGELYE